MRGIVNLHGIDEPIASQQHTEGDLDVRDPMSPGELVEADRNTYASEELIVSELKVLQLTSAVAKQIWIAVTVIDVADARVTAGLPIGQLQLDGMSLCQKCDFFLKALGTLNRKRLRSYVAIFKYGAPTIDG